MQAVRTHEFGGLDSLRVEDAPTPEPGEGEVLVRIRAANINPVDWKTCAGEAIATLLKDPFPFIPGWDVSGVVEEAGSGVSDFRPGDVACGMVRWPLAGAATRSTSTPRRRTSCRGPAPWMTPRPRGYRWRR